MVRIAKHRRNIGEDLNDTQTKILELLSIEPQLSAAKLADRIGIANRNIESYYGAVASHKREAVWNAVRSIMCLTDDARGG